MGPTLTVAAALSLRATSVWAAPDHTSYDLALGQIRLSANRPNGTDARGFFRPSAVAVDRSHAPNHVYVADPSNGRILAWRDSAQFRRGAPPDLIIGQADEFAGARLHSGDRSLSAVGQIYVDGSGTLWAADGNNGRVVGFRWPFQPGRGEVRIDLMIGQTEFGVGYYDKACNGGFLFGGAAGAATAQTLCNPTGVTGDEAGNLWVADRNNHRVLFFPAPIPARGATATLVYGQDDFSGRTCNKGAAGPDSATLCTPNSVYFTRASGTPQLYVSETLNNRVVVYDDPLNKRGAARVFGQPNFTTPTAGNGMGSLYYPGGVTVSAAGVVFISDNSSHRVVGYAPPFNGVGSFTPSFVLGQAELGGYFPNRVPGTLPMGGPTAATISAPGIPVFDGQGALLLPDSGNHRVLIYDRPQALGPAADAVVGQDSFTRGGPNRSKAAGLVLPAGLALDRPDPRARPGEAIHLYVSDFGNNRVLGYADLSRLRTGLPPDLVIGQDPAGGDLCNQGRSTADAGTLCWPRGLSVDPSGDLWVADAWNHRVLRFPRPFAQPAGQTRRADRVLGQKDFASRQPNRDGSAAPNELSLMNPAALALGRDGLLWVADQDNDRVVAYAPPFTDGMAASRVLIGPVESADAMRARGCPTSLPAGKGKGDFLCVPTGISVDADGDLWVAERENHRVVRYGATPPAGEKVVPAAPKAILGQTSAAGVAANGGQAAPGATTLRQPAGVSVEVRSDAAGKPTTVVIAVADTRNNRVLLFDPIKSGFAPAATGVVGQDGMFNQGAINRDDTHNDDPAGVERGLFYPGVVLAEPEGLFIAESGLDSSGSARPMNGSPPTLFRLESNHRVLVIKGASYPPPPPSPDLASPDLASPGDAAGPGPEQPGSGGCGCQVGRGADAAGPGGLLLLVLLGGLLRRGYLRRFMY